MSKYDKMIELNQKNSTEKIERAQKAIYEMMQEEEKVTIPKLMKKTGLSRGFFYKNPAVRKEVDRAIEQQGGLVDKRRKIIDMAMENRIVLLEHSVAELKKENADLRKQNEKLKSVLNKRDLNMLRKL